METKVKNILWLFLGVYFLFPGKTPAAELTETSFLITEINPSNLNKQGLWDFLESNHHSGIEVTLREERQNIFIGRSNYEFTQLLDQIKKVADHDSSRVIPVFMHFDGEPILLDNFIQQSPVRSLIFHLPRGEAWPPLSYLVQTNRRVLFFISGTVDHQSRMLHQTDNYILEVPTGGYSGKSTPEPSRGMNRELMMVDEFDQFLRQVPPNNQNRNLVPDYINFLLENWTKYGKRPNFIFVGEKGADFDFIIPQLQSFTWINGTIKVSGKIMDKVYWRNPDVSITGGRFSFPYRGGEEISLTPYAAGYRMTPEQIIVTGEMEVPENYTIMANSLPLDDQLVSSFSFEGSVTDRMNPSATFSGENYTFSQDLERGTVLKLPENASLNLGTPGKYGLRNSSFTVSYFVKFTEILEFGDNAVLGNYESEYRRGLHLILRSGHPYFGLWANDYVSEEKLEPNIWYHMAWRYIVETGEQAIFLNGKNIGSSSGHPPFSGTADIHLGSALSQAASLRGYIDDLNFWQRALAEEEINRLALDEEVLPGKNPPHGAVNKNHRIILFIALPAILILLAVVIFLFRKNKSQKMHPSIQLPKKDEANQIHLFGEFKVIDKDGKEISQLFTPKVKELFLFILFGTLNSESGAVVTEINEQLWPGLPVKKVTNNRAVTLNKLRKILRNIEGLEVVSQNGFLRLKMNAPFFCDYAEAFKLCQIPDGMDKQQLETFFLLVKKGRFLKGINWPWLDEMIGFTGNQVIDNLLKLASIYKKENKPQLMDAIAKRILKYDDLNEEAIFLQTWASLKAHNRHQAKFNFGSFRTKYKESLGENYPMDFNAFVDYFSERL